MTPVAQPSGPPPGGDANAAPGADLGQATGQALGAEEIEALLAFEAANLPPESHLEAPPVPLATREPGRGRLGSLAVWLLLAFIVLSVWQSMRWL